jgi:hypothetical protein
MAGLVAGGVALAAATSGQAENWFAFYIVPSGVAYVDKDSIILRPGHVSAKVQSTFPAPQRLQKEGRTIVYTKAIDDIDIDCKARVYRFLYRDLYDDSGRQQTTISDPDNVMLIQDRTPQDRLAIAYCPKN